MSLNDQARLATWRKLAYYGGAAMTVLGIVLFVSNFWVISRFIKQPFTWNPLPELLIRGAGGIAVSLVGQVVRQIGLRGLAGSGIVLDPARARNDLKPWAHMAGGLVNDALTEVNDSGHARPNAFPPQPVAVKVRCPKCRTLNDEDARFCKACAIAL